MRACASECERARASASSQLRADLDAAIASNSELSGQLSTALGQLSDKADLEAKCNSLEALLAQAQTRVSGGQGGN
eukprot:4304805-Pleurochrysis_carterae.AAC.2